MFFLIYYIYLLYILTTTSKIIMVMEIFRHGAREPVFDYWNARSFREFGELTPVGMHQHYVLGQNLRKIYINDAKLLSIRYKPEELYVRSTDLNRTIVSAISQLYGLYPLMDGPILPKGIRKNLILPPFMGLEKKKGKRLWNDSFGLDKGFQPIPVLSFQEKDDVVIRPYMPMVCPVNIAYEKKQRATEKYRKWDSEFNGTFKVLESALLANISDKTDNLSVTLETAPRIYDVFQTDIYSNKRLPEGITEELWKNLTFITNMHLYYVKYGTLEQQRFHNTPFFDEIMNNFDDKINNKTSFKFKMYSSHDMTLAFIMTGLNITSYQCIEDIFRNNETDSNNCFGYPEFASNMLIELHLSEIDDKYLVMVRYNGEYVKLCEKNTIICDYQEFKQRLKAFQIEDFAKTCKNRPKKSENDPFLMIYE